MPRSCPARTSTGPASARNAAVDVGVEEGGDARVGARAAAPAGVPSTAPSGSSTRTRLAMRMVEGMSCETTTTVMPKRWLIVDQQRLDAARRDRVEPRERLVAEQDDGARDDGARQRGALHHAAGELAGQQRIGVEQADGVEALVDALRRSRRAGKRPRSRSGKARLSKTVMRVEQRAALEQHAELAAHPVELALGELGDVLAVDQDVSGQRLDEPADQAQGRALAGAAAAQNHRDPVRPESGTTGGRTRAARRTPCRRRRTPSGAQGSAGQAR